MRTSSVDCDRDGTAGGTAEAAGDYGKSLPAGQEAPAVEKGRPDEKLLYRARLGAVVGWCHSRYDGWGLMVKYWRMPPLLRPARFDVRRPRRLRYFAGVMSHHRGRHWNRKRGQA